MATVRNLLMAWVLTLPVAILLSGSAVLALQNPRLVAPRDHSSPRRSEHALLLGDRIDVHILWAVKASKSLLQLRVAQNDVSRPGPSSSNPSEQRACLSQGCHAASTNRNTGDRDG